MALSADVDGNFNTTVQIVGDGNAVTLAGARRLAITKHGEGSLRARVRREFDLLKPYARALAIVGREEEQRSLRAWLTSGDQLSIRVLTGYGGSGKTRLALDLCDNLPDEDWQAGFLDGDDLKTYCGDASMVDWAWTKPTLVVVDYAATFVDALHRWLGRLADHMKADAPALRILLLERQADMQAGWWRTLFGGGKARDEIIRELLDPEKPMPIHPLSAPNLRKKIFLAALVRTAEQLGKEPPVVEDSGVFDNRLADLTWGGRPLFLMMAAMLAARDGVGSVLELSRIDLAMDLAKRELRRIGAAAKEQGLDDVQVETLAGYVTLCQGLDRDALIAAVGIVQKQLHRSGDAGPIIDLLHDQLPSSKGAVAAIIPDIIGEAVMLQTLNRDDIGPDLALAAFQQTGNRAAVSIIRTAQDFAGQSICEEPITSPLAWLDRLIEREEVALDQLSVVADELIKIFISYGASLILMDHARRVTGEIIRRLEAIHEAGNDVRSELARHKSNLGNILSAFGQQSEALQVAEDAVSLRRQLAIEEPEAFTPKLADSLSNLAHNLSLTKRPTESLIAAQEALDLYRKLASNKPKEFTPDLAMSLNNVANVLGELGRSEDALKASEEAVRLYQMLVSERCYKFRPNLAMSLSNFSNRLSAIEQHEVALKAAQEAVSLFRQLASENPDAFEPNLGIALEKLANRLEEMGRDQDALLAHSEAILKLKQGFLIHRMKPMCQKYIRRCEALDEVVDEELLGPIAQVIQTMEKE